MQPPPEPSVELDVSGSLISQMRTSGESARFHLFDCRVTRVHSNRKANSGLKTIVREAGLPGRRAGRVSRDRRPKVIR